MSESPAADVRRAFLLQPEGYAGDSVARNKNLRSATLAVMLTLRINGESRALELEAGASLQQVIEGLGLKADRVAVERNGDIAPRTAWALTAVSEGDRLEIVHFVGGGSGEIWADRAKRGE